MNLLNETTTRKRILLQRCLLAVFLLLCISLKAQLSYFDPQVQPVAPDYSQERNWAALPFRSDAADMIPTFEKWVDDSLKAADVFFIYPTVYMKGETWNADVNDKRLDKKIDKKPLRYQASVFNQSCRVFAPLYRQASMQAIYKKEIAAKSLPFAYEDVKRAFQYYLLHYNNGRPIIIASHSQGSYHALKLLSEFFDTTALRNNLVCAYVVGWGVTDTLFTNLKPCNNGNRTECYNTWASFKEGYDPGKSVLYGNVCVNPVTWNRDTVAVDAARCEGSLLLSFNKRYDHICATQIHNNYLWVKSDLPIIRSANNLHVGDYNLFWFDIRKNVKDRIAAFLQH